MKIPVAALLTDEPLHISGVPHISSVTGTLDIVRPLGLISTFIDHNLKLNGKNVNKYQVPFDVGSHYRTATMVIGPLLNRFGRAIVPNPGGCRIGQRPINHHIDAITKMGARVRYNSEDGYYYIQSSRLQGINYTFPKNTHTGTETLILAAVLASGTTIINNAAAEPEVDDLIRLLLDMGAIIRREGERKIIIQGVPKLHGASFRVMADRNETITFAIAAIATHGDLIVEGTDRHHIASFLDKLNQIGAHWEAIDSTKTRFYNHARLKSTDIITSPYPGFMTDWQAPWTLLMTQCDGISTVHETIFEDRFSYVEELKKMGAKIDFFSPKVANPKDFYNFDTTGSNIKKQAVKITGQVPLHDAILKTTDLRAGATLVIAGCIASGITHVHGIEHIDRGYENLDQRLQSIGADIKRVKE